MNWNNENVIGFIEAYKEKHVLWDPSNKSYYNRIMKQEAWEELSVEMKCKVDELKKKMEYLLAALRREKSKMKKTSTTGKGADKVYRSTWFAFKHLQFVMDRNKPRPRSNTSTEGQGHASKDYTSEDEENDQIYEDHDQSQDKHTRSTVSTEFKDQTTHNNTKNPSQSEFKSPHPKKRKYVAHQDPMLQTAFDLLKTLASADTAVSSASTAPATGLDQYQLYGNYLAGKFRGYSKQTYMAVEHQINNLLYNADCGQYEDQRGDSNPAMVETKPPQMDVTSSKSKRAQNPAPYTAENQVKLINNSPDPEINYSSRNQVDDSSMDSEDSFK